ncbi:hypothetical protein FGU65_11285 [Methanoculleus sp. FWC-SCC1]|uniref:Uncharacterized protein n=1 Tax=Methanoculleus frigidifontis TaxID=2584085 RepID=A0ABT8MBZ9_9EURY|nr:hypothetical protein [Methanoculleus sp. FWC-SCC1]MDN7025467.1 hypothetical protein [Methanoculleus sp. FWC-SCC1]
MAEEYVKTKIERVRYLFRFETLSSYTAISEITFSNEDTECINIIQYDLGEYKPFLKITDTNGELLEFAKAQEAGREGCSDYLINIYLPQNRELKPRSRRTITFQNFSPSSNDDEEAKYENAKYVRFHFEMADQVNSYVIIEAAEHFDFDDTVDIVDRDGAELDKDELMRLVRERVLVGHKSGRRAYLSFKGDAAKRTLRVTHRHDVPKRLLNWIRVGLAFGGISAFFLPVGLFYSFNNGLLNDSSLFVTYPVFVITTLVIIKGWLFLKDLDRDLEFYNKVYIALVAILIVELIGIFTLSFLVHGACPWLGNCNSTTNPSMITIQQINLFERPN